MKINVTQSSLPTFEEYCTEIKSIWENHWLTNNGEKVCELEAKLKKYKEVNNIVLYTNGHLALEATISAFQFPIGSEIITTPFTFVSTSNAIVRTGMVPVFCDIEPDNLTLDPKKIEALITSKTVAILPVHVYGNMCDVEEIERIAKKHNLKVIYDSAHAFGVKFKGKNSATFGDISMFSFHATKVFSTGEGGALALNDWKLVHNAELIKNFGIKIGADPEKIGFNGKMSELSAALGICNLRRVDEDIKKRKVLTQRYRENLSDIKGIETLEEQEGVTHNYSYMSIFVKRLHKSRGMVYNRLMSEGIFPRKYFFPLITDLECYREYKDLELPIAREKAQSVLALPIYPELSIDMVDKICSFIKDV